MQVVKLPSRNQQSGHSEHWGLLLLEVGRIWTSASFCTENIRNCGAQKSLLSFVLSFIFFPPCVLFTFPEMEVLFFYCTFWYLFESNVIVWLYFTSWLSLPHLGSELSKCFQNKQFINFSLVFLNLVCFVFLVSPVICVAWLQGEIKRDFLPIVSLSIEIC